jgi:hypothetical protein
VVPAAQPIDINALLGQINQDAALLGLFQNNLGAVLNTPQFAQALPGFLAGVKQQMQDDVAQLAQFEQQLPTALAQQFQAFRANPNVTPDQIAAEEGALLQFFFQFSTVVNTAINQAVTNFLQAQALQLLAGGAGGGGGGGGGGGSAVFVGSVFASTNDSFGGTNNLSGTARFDITGDGSLLNPFGGTLTVNGKDNFVIMNQIVPTMGFGTGGVSSNLHQILVPTTSAAPSFSFSFNGTVSATEQNVLGTLTINLPDGTTAMSGVNATRQ